MGKRKTKAIQADLGIFRHKQAYPGIIQAYSGILRALCNCGIFRTVVFRIRIFPQKLVTSVGMENNKI